MLNNSKILLEAYETFILPLGGKKVPTPYRMNDIGSFQKLRPEFQGKSSPEILTKTTKKLAKEQGFDLNKASVEEIREFMRKNKLGIDCSGFVYRLLNYLVQTIYGKPLTSFGFEHVGRTNVAKLTSDEMSIKVDFKDAKPGDLIKIDTEAEDGLLHTLVILEVNSNEIIYAHSCRKTRISGVHKDNIKNGQFPEDLTVFKYNEQAGDGVRRLKVLS